MAWRATEEALFGGNDLISCRLGWEEPGLGRGSGQDARRASTSQGMSEMRGKKSLKGGKKKGESARFAPKNN